MVKILDSTYAKSYLEQVAAKAAQMNAEEGTRLLRILQYFDNLFGVTLRDWDIDTVNIESNPDYKLFNCKYYKLPIINKENFLKELQRLVKIGVLTPVQQSQCDTPVFIIPNKDGTVRFITDYRRLNQKIVRNPYPLPRIGETMEHLEGFQYTTTLDLKMINYTIWLSPASQDITTIVTEFG